MRAVIAALASRCLDPTSGAVRIDGVDLREAEPDRVRTVVVVRGQDAHLFDTTIRQNPLIARPGATDLELWRALAAVRLEHWVRGLPAGLDTRVGQLGDAVSGGERQRIALACAASWADARLYGSGTLHGAAANSPGSSGSLVSPRRVR